MRVSICCITYNHAQYIRAALDSMLMQKVSFDYEIVIGEDCSTDGTRAIIEEYCKKFPGTIRLIAHETNQGMIRNFMTTLKACKGEFIAFCEGDDYWTDPEKLAKQVAFLQSNPEYCLTCHNCDTLLPSGVIEKNDNMLPSDRSFDIETFSSRPLIASMSIMMRNADDLYFPPWMEEAFMGDLPFFLLYTRRGKIKYFSEVMGIYRIHNKGAWSSASGIQIVSGFIFVFEKLMQEQLPEKAIRNLERRLQERLTQKLNFLLFNASWSEVTAFINGYTYLREHYGQISNPRLKLLFIKKFIRSHNLKQISSSVVRLLIRKADRNRPSYVLEK